MRRGFHEARDDHPRITACILYRIAQIYRIEPSLRERRACTPERQKTRWLESRKHYKRLGRLITHLSEVRAITPGNPIGRTLRYAIGQWPMAAP